LHVVWRQNADASAPKPITAVRAETKRSAARFTDDGCGSDSS